MKGQHSKVALAIQDYEDEHEGGHPGAVKRVKSQPWTLKQRSSLSEHLLRFSCIRHALHRGGLTPTLIWIKTGLLMSNHEA